MVDGCLPATDRDPVTIHALVTMSPGQREGWSARGGSERPGSHHLRSSQFGMGRVSSIHDGASAGRPNKDVRGVRDVLWTQVSTRGKSVMQRVKRWLPSFLFVLPSIILVGVFVYGFIGKSIATSFARVTTRSGRVKAPGGWGNYAALLSDDRYLHSLWNLLVLTVVFVVGTMIFGLLWALLLEKGIPGEGLFRSIFLFPMAVSFVAAGVIWRWLLSPAQGGQAVGLNQLFQIMGLPGLQSTWYSAGRFNMAAMAIPAIWQLSGYIMALFLAGFRGISEDQREAARVDGASEFKLYWHVLFPQLSPIALSALIIVGHMSMKMFDLIYAIAGQSSFITEVPATLMWVQMFQLNNPTMAAVNATLLLLIVAVVVVPYLVYTNRTEKGGR